MSSSDLIRRSSRLSGRKSKVVGGVAAVGFRSGSGLTGACTGGGGAVLTVFILLPDWEKARLAKTVIRRNTGSENFLMAINSGGGN